MAAALRLVLGDQLTGCLAGLRDLDRERDVVLLAEVQAECTYVRHHKQKIVLVLSAMRHFAEALRSEGIAVDYVTLDDPDNSGSIAGELDRAVARHAPNQVILTHCGEWRLDRALRDWCEDQTTPVELREDDRFFASRREFAGWTQGRKQLRMEYWYRDLRRRSGLLMEGEEPAGGSWNYDKENRKRLPKDLDLPERLRFRPDAMTRRVMDLVEERFPDHFGELKGFSWAVTAADAERALEHFIADCLPAFGDYQDAMRQGDGRLYHGLLSPYINIGLLDPRRVCEAVEQAWREGAAPLNAVEGFIRQILGWREYVRGLYWLRMPDYAEGNALRAERPLPAFYWTAETDLACLAAVVAQTRESAYAHHIQRLMVTGTFALLAGLDPKAVNEWYMIVYADAFEWVELPNVQGMALFADGGVMASKPYAASGKYIDRMSDYCKGCRYDVRQSEGDEACPFNYLYWDFLQRNAQRLRGNPRLGQMYRNLERMSASKRQGFSRDAKRFLENLEADDAAT
ncbi:MAG: cryptochrome/photolyase family protein [Rhodospirillales bacterium]